MNNNIWIFNQYATDMFSNKGGRHLYFAKELQKKGYNISIFCANTFHFKEEKIKIEKAKYREDILENTKFVFIKTLKDKGNGISRILNMISFAKNLYFQSKKYIKNEQKPNIIITSSPQPLICISGILLAKKLKIPCIVEVRDLWPEAIFYFKKISEKSMLGKILYGGEKWIYIKSNAIIFTKEGDTDHIREMKWDNEHGGKIDLNKCYYINNGVNVKEFNNLINDCKLDDKDINNKKFKVIYTGAVRPINDVGKILDAAKLINNINIQFLIYGQGSEQEKIKKRIKDEEIKNVLYKGNIEKKYIPYILSKASINLLNYSQTQYNWTRGNSSNKLFEYMASGKPIISTVKMGYDIIEKYDVGFSIENCTPQKLADTIKKIYYLNSEQYNYYCKNAKKAAKDFDFEILTKRLIRIIEGL